MIIIGIPHSPTTEAKLICYTAHNTCTQTKHFDVLYVKVWAFNTHSLSFKLSHIQSLILLKWISITYDINNV